MSGRAARVDVQIAAGAPVGVTAARLRALARFVLAATRRPAARSPSGDPPSVSLVVTDDATIRQLHDRHMGIDEPTDVLTFAFDAADDAFISVGPALLGEVVVSYETAASQATAYGQTAAREVEFLIVHGLLHLLGEDDATPEQRAAMLARQEALLAAFERDAARAG